MRGEHAVLEAFDTGLPVTQARGMASATYVSLLVRSHLHNAAPLPKAEYLALRQLILELSAER
jgi:hypothetical protein